MNCIETKPRNDIVLNSYALAKSAWLKDDYISSFVPMAVALIGKKGFVTIDLETFSSDFEIEYGFRIPSHPTIKLLSIMQKQNYISFDDTSRFWHPNIDNISKYDITAKKEYLHTQINALIDEVINYAHEQFCEDITHELALSMLFSFIQSNCSKILNGEFAEYQNSYKDRNIIAKFISNAYVNNKTHFGVVKQIVIGRLLVDAITLTENGENSQDFSSVSIYIDTRYILNIIGFYGEYRQTAFIELITKMHQQGAKLFVFKHTLDEADFILRGCEKWIDSLDYDPEKASSASRYLKSTGKDKKYVQGLIVGLRTRLDQNHIKTDVDSLIGDDYKYQIDREALKKSIISCYEANGIVITDRVKETIEYDVDSVQAIYYKRENMQVFNINETKAFLLTTNKNLVYASKKFHSEFFHNDTLQSCISDIYVGTFVWARSGVQYCESIIESKLIADCSVAMEPTQYAITKFCEYVHELKDNDEITDGEYIALKCYGLSTQAVQPMLMNPNEYSYKDLHEVMEEIRQKTIKDEKDKYDIERSKFQEQIDELREKYGIKEDEFTKYRDMALKYVRDDEIRNNQELKELLDSSKSAEENLKITPIAVNAVFNIIVQLALFWITQKGISLGLRIAIPIFSIIVGLTIQFNWWQVRDRIKYRLVFYYKKKLDNEKLKNNIADFLKEKDAND